MQMTSFDLPAEAAGMLDLGVVLGQNHAFGLVAGRCSAAQAETLRRLREEKKYKACTPHWREFCPKYLNMSRTQADRIIQLFEEFGPGYFELSQLTRVSAETYRAIEPAIKEGALHFNGETIELDPDNAQRVAAAVAELRRTLPPPEPEEVPLAERIASIDRRCCALLDELGSLSPEPGSTEWELFAAALERARMTLSIVSLEKGIA